MKNLRNVCIYSIADSDGAESTAEDDIEAVQLGELISKDEEGKWVAI